MYHSSLKFCLLLFGLLPGLLLASDLEDIIQSTELKRFERAGREQPDSAGLTPGTNIYALFTIDDGKSMIDLWLDIPDGKFRLIKSSVLQPDTARGSIREYRSRDGVDIKLEAWVPHPRQEDAARFRLLPEFAALTRLQVKFIEDLKVQNRKAQLLTLEDGNCLVNIDLTRAALASFKSSCTQTKTLLEFIELFSLDRFEQKLNS